jgi:hypothetical protein
MGVANTKTLILGAAILFNVVSANAGEAVRLRVPISTLMAPAFLRVYIMVEPNAENRALKVSAESPEFFRSSEMPLDGEGSARVTVLIFRDLPSGSYEVTAELIGADGRNRGRAFCFVTVV